MLTKRSNDNSGQLFQSMHQGKSEFMESENFDKFENSARKMIEKLDYFSVFHEAI